MTQPTTTTHVGGGGFVAGLKRTDWAVTGGATFLASEHYMAKRSGITLDSTAVSADGNGNKIVKAGTFVVPNAGTGKYAPYGGTGTPDPDKSGYTFESVNLRDGDVVCGIVLHGSVYRYRVTPSSIDAATRTATAGRILFQ
jgi:hypothetical protein